jgi:hypothetical protein
MTTALVVPGVATTRVVVAGLATTTLDVAGLATTTLVVVGPATTTLVVASVNSGTRVAVHVSPRLTRGRGERRAEPRTPPDIVPSASIRQNTIWTSESVPEAVV